MDWPPPTQNVTKETSFLSKHFPLCREGHLACLTCFQLSPKLSHCRAHTDPAHCAHPGPSPTWICVLRFLVKGTMLSESPWTENPINCGKNHKVPWSCSWIGLGILLRCWLIPPAMALYLWNQAAFHTKPVSLATAWPGILLQSNC